MEECTAHSALTQTDSMCVCCFPLIKRIIHLFLSSSLPLFPSPLPLFPPPQVVMEAACFAIQPIIRRSSADGSAGEFNGSILQKIMSIDDTVRAGPIILYP